MLSKEQLDEVRYHYEAILGDTHLLIEYTGTKGPAVSIREAYEGLTKELRKVQEELAAVATQEVH